MGRGDGKAYFFIFFIEFMQVLTTVSALSVDPQLLGEAAARLRTLWRSLILRVANLFLFGVHQFLSWRTSGGAKTWIPYWG